MRADAPIFIPNDIKHNTIGYSKSSNDDVTSLLPPSNGNDSINPHEPRTTRKNCPTHEKNDQIQNVRPLHKHKAINKTHTKDVGDRKFQKHKSNKLCTNRNVSKNDINSKGKKKQHRRRRRKTSVRSEGEKSKDQNISPRCAFVRDESTIQRAEEKINNSEILIGNRPSFRKSFPPISHSPTSASENPRPNERICSESRWSDVTKIGHDKREAELLRIKREYATRQQELETYTKLETLGSNFNLDGSKNQICVSTLDGQIGVARKKNPEEDENCKEEIFPCSQSPMPGILHDFNRENNIVKIPDTRKLRVRLSSLMDEMKRVEEEEVEYPSCSSSTSSDSSGNIVLSLENTSSDDTLSLNDQLCEHVSKQYPLHHAIINNDIRTTEMLLSLPINVSCRETIMPFSELQQVESLNMNRLSRDGISVISALQLAILLDRPNHISLLLNAKTIMVNDAMNSRSVLSLDFVDNLGRNALMLACSYASDACVRSILSFGPKLSAKNQKTGDSALHIACCHGEASTVELLLYPSGSTGRCNGIKKNRSMCQRLICIRNYAGETPLHVACSIGRLDIVEVIFALCTPSCAAKVLGIMDGRSYTPLLTAIEEGATEIVRHILEWRCNERDMIAERKSTSSQNECSESTCPLALAVVTGNVEMVYTLIECRDSPATKSCNGFDYNDALSNAARCFDESYANAVEIINVLIKAGANPYNNNEDVSAAPLFIAASRGQINFVNSMIDTFAYVQKARQEQQQKDNLLRQKSKVSFSLKDSKEDEATKNSIQDTLVKVLLFATQKSVAQPNCKLNSAPLSQWLSVSLAIMKKGFSLSPLGMNKLVGALEGDKKENNIIQQNYTFMALYTQPLLADELGKVYEAGWSMVCLHLKWVRQELSLCGTVYCDWLKKRQNSKINIPCWALQLLREDECYLIVEGKRLLAHKSILSHKSKKLQAAINFAEMKNNFEDCNCETEVHLDAEFSAMKLLLIHCYHGSIVSGLTERDFTCSRQLLDLFVLGEEYLCPSLAKECAMRLLSNNPYGCFCKYCSSAHNVRFQSAFQAPRHNTNSTFSYSYSIQGPPALLTSGTIMDILTSTQDIMPLDSSQYSVFLGKTAKNSQTWSPLMAVRLITCRILLLNFNDVLRSASFFSMIPSMFNGKEPGKIEDHNRLYHDASILLLQICLEELYATLK